jgi:hypothetical protein
LNARPQFNGEIGKNTVVVISSSSKVPLSRVDATSEQATDALAVSLRQQSASLADAVKAASGGANGTIVGTVPDVNLDKPPPTPTPVAAPPQPPAPVAKADTSKPAPDSKTTDAEWQIKIKELEAQLQTQLSRQREAEARAKEADARARQAEADARQKEAAATQAALDNKSLQFTNAQAEEKVAAPTLDEDSQLGRKQRALIQERLRDLGLYTGAIDSIMGPLTREAIMGFQKNRGAQVTGYLTADQFNALLSTGKTQR